METWQRNQEVILSGRGSEQERAHDRRCICEICNPEESEEVKDGKHSQ